MEQLQAYFEQVWQLPLCKLYHDDGKELKKPEVIRAGQELQNRYEAMQREHPAWFETCDYTERTLPVTHMELIANPVHCYAKEPIVYYTMTELMARAGEEVRFHTPYIICNNWMLEHLEQICDAVPGTVMLTNSVANNGNPFGAMDYQRNKGRILETGVEILEYDQGVSYHGKCFVADDRLSGIGSFNWDMRSTYINTEILLIIDSREVNAELRKGMMEYEQKALAVADIRSSTPPEGVTPQEISLKQQGKLLILRLLTGWTRFLM